MTLGILEKEEPHAGNTPRQIALYGRRRMTDRLRYRRDVDGLRSVAVLSVLAFHALPDLWPGGFIGVDVFFVISGYLIGSILLAEFDRTGAVDFVEFWARRTRRLAPSALLVIVSTLAGAAAMLPPIEVFRVGHDAIFAALYLSNWQNLLETVSYFDEGGGPSLFLHFWSLAVEEQFYLYFSAVFLAAGILARRRPGAGGRVALVLVGGGILSFGVNLWVTSVSQPEAFFGVHTRIWQLTAGVCVGLAERAGRLPSRWLRPFLSAVGLLTILGAGCAFDGKMTYPGLAAVVPVAATVAILLAGAGGHLVAYPQPLLSSYFAVAIGRLSYVLYLWHWPVFEFWKTTAGQWSGADVAGALVVTALLSVATHFWLENPVRHAARLRTRPGQSLALLLSFIAAVAAGGNWASRAVDQAHFIRLDTGRLVDLEAVRHDLPQIYEMGCHVKQSATVPAEGCLFGEPGAPLIVLFGDSHAAHWFPALEEAARANGLALMNVTKSGCTVLDVPIFNNNRKREYTECAEWRSAALDRIIDLDPFLVLIGQSSAHRPYDAAKGERIDGAAAISMLAEAEGDLVLRLAETGIRVGLLRDTPVLPDDPLDCLAGRGREDTTICRWSLAIAQPDPDFPFGGSHGGAAEQVDLTAEICPDDSCRALRDGLIVFRDTNHLARDFARHLAGPLAKELGLVAPARTQ